MSKTRIAIIGNLNIDLIIRGIVEMPKWGQESFGASHVAATAGQAGYLALGLAGLGAGASVVSALGDDEFGVQIYRDLTAANLDLSGVERIAGARTAITVGIVRTDGERAFVSDFTPLEVFSSALVRRHWSALLKADVVCLVGIFCLPAFTLAEMSSTLRDLRAAGKTTVLDTGWDPGNWRPETLRSLHALLAEVDVFLPNLDEAKAITGESTAEDAAKALRQTGPNIVVVKCGADGGFVLGEGEAHHLPALPTHVHDAVGAGDAFNAGFLFGLESGWTLRQALAFGNAAASIYVERLTNRFANEREVLARMARYDSVDLPGQARA